MARKVTDGPLRNRERTKKNVIAAVGLILKKDGFSGLNISKVAAKARIDRRLIYDYFGGLEGVVSAYLNTNDYWKIDPGDLDRIVSETKADAGKGLACAVLQDQFDSLMGNEEMRRIITWGLSERIPALKELDLKRESTGEYLLREVCDPHFSGSDKNFRAIYGILMGGVYYLTLHARIQEHPFCGIDLGQAEGEAAIKKALLQIIDWAYGVAEPEKK